MTVVAAIAATMLGLSAVMAVVHIVRAPSTLDRAAALEVLLSCCIGAIAVIVATTRESALLIVLVILTLVTFVGAVSIARFVSGKDDG